MNNALEVGEFTLHFGSEVDDVNSALMKGEWWLTLMTTYTGNIIKVVSDQKTSHVHHPKANSHIFILCSLFDNTHD